MKSVSGVARFAPSAVNPPKWSFAWLHVIASAARHPRHTRSLQPLWQHEPRVPTKICITRAHLFYSVPACGSSVSEITPPTQADRTGHPPRKLLSNSGTPVHPPGEDAIRPQSPLARTQPLNTSAIRMLGSDLIPSWFNDGRICWLRCAPQQYTLQGWAWWSRSRTGGVFSCCVKVLHDSSGWAAWIKQHLNDSAWGEG